MDTSQMIFVFGSNLSGIHGAGAAAHAHKNLKYPWGINFGLHGTAFAIPTKDRNVRDTLELKRIIRFVSEFIRQAQDEYPHLDFQVTAIGCGLAGLQHQDIAPMFVSAPVNCYFDTLWQPWLGDSKQYWGTF